MNKKDLGYSTGISERYAVIGNPSFEKFNSSSGVVVVEEGSVDVYKKDTLVSDRFLFLKTLNQNSFLDYIISTENNTTSSDGSSGSFDLLTEILTPSDDGFFDSSSFKVVDSTSVKILSSDFGRTVDVCDSICAIGASRIKYTYIQFDNVVRTDSGIVEIHDLDDEDSLKATVRFSDITSSITASLTQPQFSFARSVSINKNFLAVGSPFTNGGTGAVFIFESGSTGYIFNAMLTASLSSEVYYGASLQIDRNFNKLVVGNSKSNNLTSSAYVYEYISGSWMEKVRFNSTFTEKNLNFISVPQYDVDTTTANGFGNSVSIYCSSSNSATVAVGSPYDRTFKEYSGSACYKNGCVYVFDLVNCEVSTSAHILSSSHWNSTKLYGDSDVFKYNRFGHAVSINKDNLLISSPKFLSEFTSSYIQNTLLKVDDCNIKSENEFLGMFYIYKKINSNWNNVYAKYKPNKKYGYPYNFYAHDVSMFNNNVIVGNPIAITDKNRIISSEMIYNVKNLNGGFDIFDLVDFESYHHVGNIFYKTGKMVVSTSGSILDCMFDSQVSDEPSYDIAYNSKEMLYEKEIIVTVNPGEFNYSTNPTSYSTPSFLLDINKSGKFEFSDCDKVLRYLYKKITKSESWWDLFPIENPVTTEDRVESSIFKFSISSSFGDKNSVTLLESNLLTVEHDYISANLESDLDINGDGVSDINDIKIIWKYFSNTLSAVNYPYYVTHKSIGIRNSYVDVVDYLNVLSGKNVKPVVLDNFMSRFISGSTQTTSSWLSPYITTIGLYNGLDLVAVAKLGTPIKNEGVFPLNFIVRFDI